MAEAAVDALRPAASAKGVHLDSVLVSDPARLGLELRRYETVKPQRGVLPYWADPELVRALVRAADATVNRHPRPHMDPLRNAVTVLDAFLRKEHGAR